MRTSLSSVCMLWLWSILSGIACAQVGPPPIEVEESKPILANGVLFTTVTEAKWRYLEDPSGRMKALIALRLRISNQTKEKLAFVTNATFFVVLKNKDGKEIKREYAVDVEGVQSPIILPGEATFSIVREGYLIWDSKRKTSSLAYFDGSGGCWTYSDLESGRHKVSFLYSTKGLPKPHLVPIGRVRVWEGEAQTPDASFEIVSPSEIGKANDQKGRTGK